jgi:hypothetical protein
MAPKKKIKHSKYLKVHKPQKSKELRNPKLVQETLLDCIKNGIEKMLYLQSSQVSTHCQPRIAVRRNSKPRN